MSNNYVSTNTSSCTYNAKDVVVGPPISAYNNINNK